MTTAIANRRGGRGRYPKSPESLQTPVQKVTPLPEYLDRPEVEALIAAAPHGRAKLLMLMQWRAGLRVSEAIAVERRDLTLGVDRPTLRVRMGKGHRARVVPVHPELETVLMMYLALLPRGHQGPLIGVARQNAWAWVKQSLRLCEKAGQIAPGRKIGTHTLRHSYARHLLMHGVPINYVSRWLGHATLSTTLIYLALLPDPAGSLALVP